MRTISRSISNSPAASLSTNPVAASVEEVAVGRSLSIGEADEAWGGCVLHGGRALAKRLVDLVKSVRKTRVVV
jgi:hypothetical protein